MKRNRLLLALAATLLCASLSAQQTTAPQPLLYANFMGVWSGSDHYEKEGVWTDITIELKITPDKRGMRFDYTYAKKGEKGYDRLTRFVTLLPDSSEVILQWKGDRKEVWQAKGLREFAATGFGAFSISRDIPQLGVSISYHGIFKLDNNAFSYQWEKGSTPRDLQLDAVWT